MNIMADIVGGVYEISERDMIAITSMINRLQFFSDCLPANTEIKTDSNALADTFDHLKDELSAISKRAQSRFKPLE